ncbi:MAG: YqgE/AlgH family protein [Gemmataceae bacterium]
MSSLAGSFLIARPILHDPNFMESVVLMIQHGAAGAFGVVVNKPAVTKSELPFPVFLGGPCESEGLLLVHGHPEWSTDPHQLAPGIFLGDQACSDRVTDLQPGAEARFRMFAGYAGWGPGQLEGELSSGAWAVLPASGAILFDTPTERIWRDLLPPMLPQPSLN